jgi:hypothetical protein
MEKKALTYTLEIERHDDIQMRGCRVSVVSTLQTQPPMVADELRLRRTSSLTSRIWKHRYVAIRLHGRFESPGCVTRANVLRRYLRCSTIRKRMRIVAESVS